MDSDILFPGEAKVTMPSRLSRVYEVYPQMSQIYADIEGSSIRMAAEILGTIW